MKKDNKQFRERFERWKRGELVYENGRPLPSFDDGKDSVEYESFIQTLPKNLQSGNYRMKRYWELNGKPKTFYEGAVKGMFSPEDDGWHARSVAYDGSADSYELMKPNNHLTRWMEDVYGYWNNPLFLWDYKIEKSPFGKYGYDRYIPTHGSLGTLPNYKDGKDSYRYYPDGQGGWFRAANDDMTRAFEGLVVTPNGTDKKFIPESLNNTERAIKARDKYNATHSPITGLPTNQGLEIVSPEFDIISLGGVGKNILGGLKYAGRKIKGLAGRANWQGDAVALTKNRLSNGGFDRLSNTFNSNITNEAVNLETANPLLIKNSNLPLVYSPERRAALLATDVHEVPSWYATGNPKHIGVSNAELGPVLYSDRPAQYIGRQASSDIAAHEYSHYVYTPNERLSSEMFQPVEGYGKYFRKANNAEVQARGTQLKNYFGLREGEPLTAEHIKYAAKHFVKDRGYDNGMTEFFKSIKDFDGVAKWLTKNSPAYIIGGFGLSSAYKFSQNE